MPHHAANRRAALVLTVVVLALLGLLPARYGEWMNAIGDKASLVVGPVTAPIYRAVRWITPSSAAQSDEVIALKNEADRWKALYLRANVDAQEAQRKLDALAKGAVLTPVPEAQLLRPVIGSTAEPGGLIQVRAGSRDGVEVNSVATTVGVQLVGRVINVGSRLCTVRVINDRASGRIEGDVMFSDAERGPKCSLFPVTNGLLQGLVASDTNMKAPGIGQLVRLDDDRWPRTSQMLVIGRISRLQKDPTGRYVITVEPTTDLERLSEVVLRIAPPEADDRGGGAQRGAASTDGSHP